MNTLHSFITEYGYLVADGAMGTMLFAAGLGHGGSPELWNVEQPEKVAAVHREYLDAGSQILLTNTFGCNRFRLQLHNLDSRAAELNRAAARLLRAEVDASGKLALVAGDIGPTGGLIQPLGELTSEQVADAFAEQAAALIEGGVDLIWIETMAALEEMQAAVTGVRSASADIPIIMTMTFDTRGRTMMGITPERAIRELSLYGAAAIGGNCGNGPEEIIGVVEKMRQTAPDAILVAKANAGVPVLEKGRPVYRASPEDMAVYAVQAYTAGARIIGACCGSTPAHIRSIAAVLESSVAAA
jgi:5-methyltetrahydrofolate--homocysteine methyltransferase